ncbi:hypothetical protein F4604DRAFT_1675878 [Suillus subluteus]|nr:hypothetical protein F4604DRAFT_1675878 [Suillus subluteus]
MTQLKPEAFKLWLPSELQPTAGCDNRLAAHKWDLWHAQALDAINEIHSHLHLWSHMSGWDTSLPPLLDSQVRHMGDMERQGTGTISWIWLDSHVDNSSSENEQVQDFEWCKACMCANHWLEEVDLLLKEMQRVIVFLRWQAEWWSERHSSRAPELTA